MTKAKSTRSETVTVRFDPKVRYIAEIAAREQQRTLSSFVEWAVRRVLTEGDLLEDSSIPTDPTQAPAPMWGEGLWDVDEGDRFFKLARMRPDLLTTPEQRLWKLLSGSMMLADNELKLSRFLQFWNDPLLNTSHLKDGGE